MITSGTVRARIDSDTKAAASKALAAMGLSVSDAIRMMLRRVADEKRLPFEVKVPNALTREAIKGLESGGGQRFKAASELFDSEAARQHSSPSGPALECLSQLIGQGKIADASVQFSIIENGNRGAAKYIAGRVPAMVLNRFFCDYLKLPQGKCVAWSLDSRKWADEIKAALRDPEKFRKTLEAQALEIDKFDT